MWFFPPVITQNFNVECWNLNWAWIQKPLLSRFRDHCERGAERGEEAEVVDVSKGTVSSWHKREALNMNPRWLRQHREDLHKPKPDQTPACRWEYPLVMELLAARKGSTIFSKCKVDTQCVNNNNNIQAAQIGSDFFFKGQKLDDRKEGWILGAAGAWGGGSDYDQIHCIKFPRN